MERQASALSKAIALEIIAWQKKRGLNQAQLAEATGITTTTLQRILAGKAEIDMSQFDALTTALNVPPTRIVEDAEAEMSSAGVTPVSLDTKRKQNEARAMTVEQIETSRHAATTDPEYGTDEPDPT